MRRVRHLLLETLYAISKLLLLALVVGLVLFIRAIPSPPATNELADGIVVLTGGAGRLTAGLQLLQDGLAPRLLVSGVGDGVDAAEIIRLRADRQDLLNCCITLGYAATNTESNAQETAAWVAEHNIRSLFVVTADYHMPRSLLELGSVMPQVRLQPYAVPTAEFVLHPMPNLKTMRLVLGEYSKTLRAHLRLWGLPVGDSNDHAW